MTTSSGGGPANNLSVNVGGVSVNYDLGPSVATVASQAYSYLGTSFNADTALLAKTITGSQSFVGGIVSPVIAAATSQQNFNDTQLPSMFQTVEDQNYSIAQSAQQVQAQTAESSIAASNAEAANAPKGGGGFCYITTAVCESLHLPDDNCILTTFRAFRDVWLKKFRPDEIEAYYRTAPGIVAAIRAKPEASQIFYRVMTRYLWPAFKALEEGREFHAYLIYKGMVQDLREYLNGH